MVWVPSSDLLASYYPQRTIASVRAFENAAPRLWNSIPNPPQKTIEDIYLVTLASTVNSAYTLPLYAARS